MKRNRKSDNGNATVEFALLLPLMLLLVLGAVDFARLFYAAITVASAARAGVQYGAQDTIKAKDTTGMQTAASNDAADITGVTATAQAYCECADGTRVDCITGTCSGGTKPPAYVQVTVQKTFTTLVDYPGIPHNTALSRTAIMRVQ
jgi:Flp pilus assembly protein TadG